MKTQRQILTTVFIVTLFFGMYLFSCKDDNSENITQAEHISAPDSEATAAMNNELDQMQTADDSMTSTTHLNWQHHWDSIYHHHDSLFWHHHNMYHHEIYAHDDHHHIWLPYDSTVDHTNHHHHPYPDHPHDSLVTDENHHHHDNSDHHHLGHDNLHHHHLDSLHYHHIHHHP